MSAPYESTHATYEGVIVSVWITVMKQWIKSVSGEMKRVKRVSISDSNAMRPLQSHGAITV